MFQRYNNYKMAIRKIKNTAYSYILIFLIIILFSLSIFLYFSLDQLTQYPLYFPSATTLPSEKFEDTLKIELRMIPRNNFISHITNKSDETENMKTFIHELFLGPQSIYLKTVVPQEFTIDYIAHEIINKRNRIFLVLKTNTTSIITDNTMHYIKKWLYYNLKKMGYKQKILLIINGKLY